MSNNLTKIRDMASSIKNKLASLTISPDALDNLDSVSSERVMLREKLATLEAAEAFERNRMVDEEKKNNSKKRRAALTELATKTEQLVTDYGDLTERATNHINDLVSVLIEREKVFTQKSTGLDKPVFCELFSIEERSNLIYEMNRSALGVYAGEFSATFERSVSEQCLNSENIKRNLFNLVKTPSRHHKPLKGANDFLVKAAKAMQFKSTLQPTTEAIDSVQPKKQGRHYVADMRDNSPVIEF